MTGKEYIDEIRKISGQKCGQHIFKMMNFGLKGQMPVLKMLLEAKEKGEEVNAGDLSIFFDVSTARIATILLKLEEQGLIIREKSKKDGRMTVVNITELGEKEVDDFHKESLIFVDKLIKGIDEDDLKTFLKVLNEMTMNVEIILKGE